MRKFKFFNSSFLTKTLLSLFLFQISIFNIVLAKNFYVAQESLSVIQGSGNSENFKTKGNIDAIEIFGRSTNFIVRPYYPMTQKKEENTSSSSSASGSPPIVDTTTTNNGSGGGGGSHWRFSQPDKKLKDKTEENNTDIIPHETSDNTQKKDTTTTPSLSNGDPSIKKETLEFGTEKKTDKQNLEDKNTKDKESKYDASNWILNKAYIFCI